MANETADTNDTQEQDAHLLWTRFIKMMTWCGGAIALTLVLMALFLV